MLIAISPRFSSDYASSGGSWLAGRRNREVGVGGLLDNHSPISHFQRSTTTAGRLLQLLIGSICKGRKGRGGDGRGEEREE